MTFRFGSLAACLMAGWLSAACTVRSADLLAQADTRFGVLFGGQIQQRKEIPFELDPMKQTLALRIELPRDLSTDMQVHWELSKPGASRASNGLASPQMRTTDFGDELFRKHTRRFDKSFAFKPGDNLGLWNIRVSNAERILLDRPFAVVAPGSRPMTERSDAGAP